MSDDIEINFKDHPQSITEIKANIKRDGALWTPRDALIWMLREIDGGLKVDALIINYREINEEEEFVSYVNAAKDATTSIGVATRSLDKMLKRINDR